MKSRLLASSVFAGAAFMAQASMIAVAQEGDEAVDTVATAAETTTEDSTARQQTVYVTGTRIQSPNLTTTSPVSSVSAQDIKLQGVTRVEDLVTQLPQAFAAQNSTVSNGSSGTATVSLRNLGSTRTLVLIDGKRMPYGSPNDPAADLNLIPGPLVERVDVLTGGASAVYGSDAIAGVVNFIMKDDYEGIQVDTQYGFFQHNNDYDTNGNLRDVIAQRAQTNPRFFKLPDDNVIDGYSKEITAIMGINAPDGRGNLTAWLGYRNNDAILEGQRDYSACAIGSASATGFTCGGSSTAYPGRFTDFATFDYTIDQTTGEFRDWNSATDQYNYGPLNYFQRPDQRYTVGFNGHYQINDNVEAYSQFMFMDYESNSQIAPTGDFFATGTLNCDNPLVSASQLAAIGCTAANIANGDSISMYIARRNVEGGGRQDHLGYQTYRGVAGLRGDLFNLSGWSYDLSAQYSQVSLTRAYTNEFSVTRLNRALNVVDDGSGNAVCASVLDGTDPNCVPWDVFTIGNVTQAALNYLQVPLLQNGTTTQNIVSGVLSGDLGQYGWKSPSADTGLQVALGLEYRRDALESITDNSFATGDGAGQGGPTIGLSGAIDAYEIFGEFQMPLVEGKPGIELLSIGGAYRFSDYSTGISSDSYKFDADYAPTSDIRFRASYQQAVRAPNVIDLFQAQGFNLFDMDDDLCDFTDPAGDGTGGAACIGTNSWQVTQAQADSGALNSPAGQYNYLQGGNPDLQPEEAETYTVGFVATPSFIPGFSASVDYYNIDITKAITTVGASITMQLCYLNGDSDACSRIQRNANGQLWVGTGNVIDTNTNIGGVSTSGIDVSAAYGFDIGSYGSLNLTMNGTYLDSYDYDPIGQAFAEYSCVAKYGNDCLTPTPEWRHRARASWATPWDGLDLSATWRYIGAVDLDTGATGRVDSTLKAQNYIDLAGQWAAKDWVTFRFGVNNVLDDDPPLSASVGTTGNGNTYPQTYDAMGRYWFVGATFDF
ncbi:MAG TPA: TonB-dependent receptor [Hyphomonas sp.]|nr:TonB-dependent receptor [Hyphomonas sp.]MCB9962458.1 TonB-dependent receptor [Hyphomonas sp.]MCB9972090.1 TonB-dependent receptor [Hyphomonas sp.]HPE47719.1 TonB-dependent receptor [Hyphomonas sp.]